MSLDASTRFILDNIRDSTAEGTLTAWPAFDALEKREVWLIGRRIGEKVLPLAVLITSAEAIRRYAPGTSPGQYDFSQVLKIP